MSRADHPRTRLHANPFWILGATTRDDRRRIVELAEEKLLDQDSDTCHKARSDLTVPRARLSAELSWLPGVSPAKALQLMALLENPVAVRSQAGVPKLAHANLLAAVFEGLDLSRSPEQLAELINDFVSLVEELDLENVLRDINEDRLVSGFPEVRDEEHVANEISELKRHYRAVVKDALNRLAPSALVDVLTKVVRDTTDEGEYHAPELLDDVVDTYEVEAQEFLHQEAANAQKLIAAARDLADHGEDSIRPLIEKLELVLRKWDRVAQPIQLSFKARGQTHELSRTLAYATRSLAVDLFNMHGMAAHSQRLTGVLRELFAELPEVAERVEEDVEALEEILDRKNDTNTEQAEWEEAITYRAEIGTVFKKALIISPDGIWWGSEHFDLDDIDRVTWGGTRQSINGIPTGTTYTIGFGSSRVWREVQLGNEDIYHAFTMRLFRAVGFRILSDILRRLRSGETVNFGTVVVGDNGAVLRRHKFLGSEPVLCEWEDIHAYSEGGSLHLVSRTEAKISESVSYIQIPNTHILEMAIRMRLKEGAPRLSDVLSEA